MNTPLDGYKTYIVAAVGLSVAIALYLRGDMAGSDLMNTTFTLLGLSALRHGVENG